MEWNKMSRILASPLAIRTLVPCANRGSVTSCFKRTDDGVSLGADETPTEQVKRPADVHIQEAHTTSWGARMACICRLL